MARITDRTARARRAWCFTAIALLTLAAATVPAASQTFKVLYTFPASDYAHVTGPLAVGSDGSLYGASSFGGLNGRGFIFQLLRPTQPGGAWTEVDIYDFYSLTDGNPNIGLAIDKGGNLYGATQNGGIVSLCNGQGCGTVYKLHPPASPGSAWTKRIMHAFVGGTDGLLPYAPPIVDKLGIVYGTTNEGGVQLGGTVYLIAPSGNGWTESVIYNLGASAANGADASTALTSDSLGNLYDTTSFGGVNGGGTVFELSPLANGAWQESVLYSFNQQDGFTSSGPVLDASGNIYGTTIGGAPLYNGLIYQLNPPNAGTNSWQMQTIWGFTGAGTGASPNALSLDPSTGALYGTTQNSGQFGCGVLFELAPPAAGGGSWGYSVIHRFSNAVGCTPLGSLVRDPQGNFYGATSSTVFEVTP